MTHQDFAVEKSLDLIFLKIFSACKREATPENFDVNQLSHKGDYKGKIVNFNWIIYVFCSNVEILSQSNIVFYKILTNIDVMLSLSKDQFLRKGRCQ